MILYPFESDGHQCGRPSTATSDYKYLYFLYKPGDDQTYSICVKDCANAANTCFPQNKWVGCEGGELSINGDQYPEYPGYGLVHFCIPDKIANSVSNDFDLMYKYVVGELNDSGSIEWARDIMHTWPIVLAVLGAGVVFSLSYLLLLRMCAMVIIYITVLAITLGLVGFGYGLSKVADDKYHQDTQAKAHKTLIILSYCLYGGAALFVLIILFMWRRIELAVAITKSATIFMGEVFVILLIPILSFVVAFGMICLWVFALGYLYSCGTLETKSDPYSAYGNVSWNNSTRDLFYYEVFGFVWIIEFKIFLTQMALALIVAYWYFDHGNGPKHHHKIIQAYWTALRYHLGSIAFASLLLTIVKFIKWFLAYLQRKVYKQGFDGNKMVKFVCGCVGCYVRCFERFIKFLDKNALIAMAYSSKSFCACAKDVLALMLTNAARFIALGSVGELFSFLGKTLITLACTIFGFYIITTAEEYKRKISSPVGPSVVFFMVGYCISSIFMSVFEMVCDCIIIFYLEDEQLNHDKASMHAPKPLHDFMEAHREKDDKTCCCCL